jgi:hypothetical protein
MVRRTLRDMEPLEPNASPDDDEVDDALVESERMFIGVQTAIDIVLVALVLLLALGVYGSIESFEDNTGASLEWYDYFRVPAVEMTGLLIATTIVFAVRCALRVVRAVVTAVDL